MTEQEFLKAAERTLDAIENALERAVDAGLEVEVERQGNVLSVTFEDDSKIIVNSHGAAREIWVAARSGGFHYRDVEGRWIDTRAGDELFAALSRMVSAQGGQAVVLGGRPGSA
jgi:CyaY protein